MWQQAPNGSLRMQTSPRRSMPSALCSCSSPESRVNSSGWPCPITQSWGQLGLPVPTDGRVARMPESALSAARAAGSLLLENRIQVLRLAAEILRFLQGGKPHRSVVKVSDLANERI